MASVPVAVAVVVASMVELVDDEPLQTGSSSHQPVVAPRGEPLMNCVYALTGATAVDHEESWGVREVMAAYPVETSDDDVDRQGVFEFPHLRGTYTASYDLHRHPSYV